MNNDFRVEAVEGDESGILDDWVFYTWDGKIASDETVDVGKSVITYRYATVKVRVHREEDDSFSSGGVASYTGGDSFDGIGSVRVHLDDDVQTPAAAEGIVTFTIATGARESSVWAVLSDPALPFVVLEPDSFAVTIDGEDDEFFEIGFAIKSKNNSASGKVFAVGRTPTAEVGIGGGCPQSYIDQVGGTAICSSVAAARARGEIKVTISPFG